MRLINLSSFSTNNNSNNNNNEGVRYSARSPRSSGNNTTTNSNHSSPSSQHDENDVHSPRAPSPRVASRKANPLLASCTTTTTTQASEQNNNTTSASSSSNNNTHPLLLSRHNKDNNNTNNNAEQHRIVGAKDLSVDSSSRVLPPRLTPSPPQSSIGAVSSLSLSKKKKKVIPENSTALMTVVSNSNNSNTNQDVDNARMNNSHSPRHHNHHNHHHSRSLSNISRERKEDDPATESSSAAVPAVRSAKPTSESGRSRGATPPRPVDGGHARNRSNDGIPAIGGGGGDNNTPGSSGSEVPNTQQTTQQRRSSRRRSASPKRNRIPRVPIKQLSTPTGLVDATATSSQTSSPRGRFANSKDHSSHSIASSGAGSMTKRLSSNSHNWQWAAPKPDPADHEQTLFEQRLCEDTHGVAVRKISQNGKPNLRYVKCLYIDSDLDTVGDSNYPASARSSVSSLARSFRKTGSSSNMAAGTAAASSSSSMIVANEQSSTRVRVLTWGKKKDVRLRLDRFVCVRKGKTTDRARRNSSPSCRILSLVTTDPNHQSLDIEAPTRLDRDKFARAFARFLDVPLVGEDKTAQSVSPRPEPPIYTKKKSTTATSEPDLAQTAKQAIAEAKHIKEQQYSSHNAPLPVVRTSSKRQLMEGQDPTKEQPLLRDSATSASLSNTNNPSSAIDNSSHSNTPKAFHDNQKVQIASLPASLRDSERSSTQAATASRPTHPDQQEHGAGGDDASQVSSLTGAGFDQEIVEELHQALTELKAELEASRAEAARAVKVAEQAIQSAENSNSNDWNSTVTHKAAEAAALAQKKSAEAMSKQRSAEERLEGERRTGAFWRRQAEAAEDEAGTLQTRAAAAEVQRAAMAEELECERRKTAAMVGSLKVRYSSTEKHQKEALESALQRNRSLELELDGTRRDLVVKNDEAKTLEESLSLSNSNDVHRSGNRMKLSIMGRKKKSQDEGDPSASVKLLSGSTRSSSDNREIRESPSGDSSMAETILKLHAEAAGVRKHFELLRKATAEELERLPEDAKMWSNQVAHIVQDGQSEISLLREKLALESAARRKLLHEVQDLRGVVRVYCRPRESPPGVKSMLSIPSQETLLLHPYEDESPMNFKFDRVFPPDVPQREVYNEIEELCLSVMDGYNICLMAHGQRGTGKTYSMLGDVKYSTDKASFNVNVEVQDFGIHLKTAQQLFSIAEHRSERFQDVFTLEIVEVYNERLLDLLAGTDMGETSGQLIMEDSKSTSRRSKRGMSDDGSSMIHNSNSHSVSSKQGSTMTKLEIRTNQNGDTVVQGSLSVEVHSFEDVYKLWQQCLSQRATRLAEQGLDLADYEASSHVIATLSVASMNVATGSGSVGKIKFVDLAGADLVQRRGSTTDPMKCPTPESSTEKGSSSNNDWKYSNRSLATLNDVVNCRSQYMRAVPYRNSTLTHLLSDNLEADTKVLLLLCISAHPKYLQETACALRFASGMRRVTIGKATKHSLNR